MYLAANQIILSISINRYANRLGLHTCSFLMKMFPLDGMQLQQNHKLYKMYSIPNLIPMCETNISDVNLTLLMAG